MSQAQLQEELIPSGGIADFVMSDAEIAALEAEEAREEFGDSGIARFEPIAKRMASYGRYGDDNLAHVETGELLVPRALLEQSPELKESIFNHLRDMGIEDPDRYVVGSSANSINPDTGMPEFFLKKIFRGVRKTVSNVAKGVSKAVSKVGKVLKKVAPVVLPIALAMTPLGAMYGAALGSGIGTLIQGGNIKDALKSALVAGAIGGISSGFTGSEGSFIENVKAAAKDPMARLTQTGRALSAGSPFQSFTPTGASEGLDQTFAEVETGVRGGDTITPAETMTEATDISNARARLDYANQAVIPPDGANVVTIDQTGNVVPTSTSDYSVGMSSPVAGPDISAVDLDAANVQLNQMPTTGPGVTPKIPATTETSFFDTAKGYASDAGDYLFRGGQTPQQIDLAKEAASKTAAQNKLAEFGYTNFADAPPTLQKAAIDAGNAAASAAGPGYIARFGPSVGLATLGATAGGFFDTPEEEPNDLAEEFQQTGSDLIAQSPETFMLAGRDPRYSQGQYVVPTQYGLAPQQTLFSNPFMRYQAPQMLAAAGGEVYPRRNGGIMPNEGIPDQDSVRALLMPGEFVMTKDAVRGLGGGNLNQGINNMYSMMRNLETRGQVA